MLMTMGPLFRRQLQEAAAGRLPYAPKPTPVVIPAKALPRALRAERAAPSPVRLVAWPPDESPGGTMLPPRLRAALRKARQGDARQADEERARPVLVYAPQEASGLVIPQGPLATTLGRQIRDTVMEMGITLTELTGPSRRKELVVARAELAFLGVAHYGRSLPHVGRALGGRDHTTILHARNRVVAALLEAGFTPQEGVVMAPQERRAIIAAHYAKPWRGGAGA
jgi:hypothetical protein